MDLPITQTQQCYLRALCNKQWADTLTNQLMTGNQQGNIDPDNGAHGNNQFSCGDITETLTTIAVLVEP